MKVANLATENQNQIEIIIITTMKKNYLILVRGSNPGFAKLDEAAQGLLYQKWEGYVGKLNQSGNWIHGAPLESSGKLLCDKKQPADGVVGDDDVSISGYMILQAENYDAVLKLCDDCPSLDIGGKLEIREASEMC